MAAAEVAVVMPAEPVVLVVLNCLRKKLDPLVILSLLVPADRVQLVEVVQLVLVKHVPVEEEVEDGKHLVRQLADLAAAEVVQINLADLQINLVWLLHGLEQNMVMLVVMVLLVALVMPAEAEEELLVLVPVLEAVLQLVPEVREDKIYIKQE